MADDVQQTKIIRIVIDSSKASDGSRDAVDALKKIEQQTGATNSMLARMGEGMASAWTKIGAIAAAKFSYDSIVGQINALIESMDKLKSRSETMKVSTDWLQGFDYAAASTGVKLATAGSALDEFARTVGQAATGNKDAIQTFNDLGVKILDAQGRVRPLKDLFVDTAARINSMSDASKANSLAVASMGQNAQAILPVLSRVAMGGDAMIAAAQKANSAVPDEAIKKWASLAGSAEQFYLKWRTFAATNFADIVVSGFNAIKTAIDYALVPLLLFVQSIKTITDFIREQRAPQAAIETLQQAQAADAATRDRVNSYLAKPFQAITSFPGVDATNPRGQLSEIDQRMAQRQTEIDRMISARNAQGRAAARGDGIAWTPTAPTTGVSNPSPRDDYDPTDKIRKQIDSLTAAAEAQDRMTAAARNGDVAFQDEETRLKSVQQAIDVYRGKLAASSPEVQNLAAKLLELNQRIDQGKLAQSFVTGTTELQKQNDILQAQLALYDQTPEVQARVIAQIKAQQDAQKAGNALTKDDIDARQQTVEINERLKAQGEQLRQVTELWTAPLKQALQNIQTTAADTWEKILDTGNVSFQSLGDAFGKTAKRMAAEFLALATIRPVMSVVIQGMNDIGLVSPATASQLGYPLGGVGGAIPNAGGYGGSIGGSGSSIGLFSTGGSGWLGSFGDWLNTPFIGQSYGGAGSYNSIGELISSGAPGLTPLGLVSGLGSIAMGAYNMFSGGGSMGSTIGGVAGMAGGLMSMAGALIPGMSALGPIGMGVGLVGGLLGGLFGGGGGRSYIVPPPAGASTSFNFNPATGNYYAWGNEQNGGQSILKSGQGAGNAVMALLAQSGGTISNPGGMWGGVQWVNYSQRTTSTGLLAPGNVYQGWNLQQDSSMDPNKAADELAAAVFAKNVVTGAITNVSKTLVQAFANVTPSSTQEAANSITMATKYDNAVKGDNLTKAEQAFQSINDNMSSIVAWAQQMGIAVQPLKDEQTRQQTKLATDFMKTVTDGLLAINDPLQAQISQIQDSYQSAVKEAQWMSDNIQGAFIDMAKVAEYYTAQEAAARQQYYSSAISSIRQAIQDMAYGSLSGASPIDTLTGSRATYLATLAQAQGGSSDAINRLAQDASSYVTAAQSYYGNTDSFSQIVAAVRAALADENARLMSAGTGGTDAVSLEAANSVLQSNSDLSAQLAASQEQVTKLQAQVAELLDQVSRLVVNRAA